MSYIDNILTQMQSTPTFQPSNINSFSDWSIETGDIITTSKGDATYTTPVFSTDLSWNGAAKSVLSNSGNKEREAQTKTERESYATQSAVSSAMGGMASDIGDLEEDYEGLAARTSKAEAGLELVGVTKTSEGYAFSSATLYTKLEGDIKGAISLYSISSGSESKTLANILADQTKISDALVVGDSVFVQKSLTCNYLFTASGGADISGGASITGTFKVNDTTYAGEDITFLTGIDTPSTRTFLVS